MNNLLSNETKRMLDAQIIANGQKLSQREIAKIVGCSVGTVNKRFKELGISPGSNKLPKFSDTNQNADRLSRLEELRDMLYEAMKDANGAILSNLSKEYRATMEEIETLKSQDAEEEDDFITDMMREFTDG